ncbi:hydroxymethylbilane synthase [Alicyclobacillus cycloheptanicus]|nr:hydroxymethylbilane synthase [Alicyclobacillus cycloheptanicus]
MRQIRVISRKSQLAMQQTRWVIDAVQALRPDWRFEIVPIVTQGDRIQNVPLSEVGGKGLFVTEVEQALLRGDGDFTVHSLKDVPAEVAPGLVLAGFPAREEPRDALISRNGLPLSELPTGARIGTSSLRRAAQLLAARPDLAIVPIRGNIDTRLRKLETDDLDAIVLAAAGLRRMGWGGRITELLALDVCLPAVGQGILGIACRADDESLLDALAELTDADTKAAAQAERALLARLEGGCQVPIAGYAEKRDGRLWVRGLVASPDGATVIRAEAVGEDAAAVGNEAADRLLAQGAAQVIGTVAAKAPPLS